MRALVMICGWTRTWFIGWAERVLAELTGKFAAAQYAIQGKRRSTFAWALKTPDKALHGWIARESITQ